MAFTLAVGTTVEIAATYSSPALAFTAASNLPETVLTMASTAGLAIGDYVEVSSGWGLLDGRIARIKALSANASITLDSIDCSDTTKYPAGTGGGSVRKVSAWTQLTQITSGIQSSGGEQQFADITTLMDRTQRQIPTVRSAQTMTIPTFYDASLAWVATVRTAVDKAVATAVKLTYPNGSKTVGNAYWGLRDIPTIEDSTLRGEVSLSFSAQPITYAS